MRKISLFIVLMFVLLTDAFAVVGGNEIDKSKEHISFISKFMSPEILLNIVFAGAVILITFALAKGLSMRIETYIEKAGNGESREELVGVLTRVSNISILTLGTAISLGILGVDMGIFMGGLGFGLGFTLKIFLSNFIAGVIMVTQGSYHNGDLIELEEKTGIIKKINALFTEVEQFDGVIFFVPNVKFLENNVKNFHINDKRRVEINVGVDYASDLVKVKKVTMQVLNNFPNILKAPKIEILVTDFKTSSINVSIRFWINSKSEYFIVKSNVTETINLAFKQASIVIPFPQVTLSNRDNFKIGLEK